MKVLVCVLLLAALANGVAAGSIRAMRGEAGSDAAAAEVDAQLAKLRSEVSALQSQNADLLKEAESPALSTPLPPPAPAAEAAAPVPAAAEASEAEAEGTSELDAELAQAVTDNEDSEEEDADAVDDEIADEPALTELSAQNKIAALVSSEHEVDDEVASLETDLQSLMDESDRILATQAETDADEELAKQASPRFAQTNEAAQMAAEEAAQAADLALMHDDKQAPTTVSEQEAELEGEMASFSFKQLVEEASAGEGQLSKDESALGQDDRDEAAALDAEAEGEMADQADAEAELDAELDQELGAEAEEDSDEAEEQEAEAEDSEEALDALVEVDTELEMNEQDEAEADDEQAELLSLVEQAATEEADSDSDDEGEDDSESESESEDEDESEEESEDEESDESEDESEEESEEDSEEEAESEEAEETDAEEESEAAIADMSFRQQLESDKAQVAGMEQVKERLNEELAREQWINEQRRAELVAQINSIKAGLTSRVRQIRGLEGRAAVSRARSVAAAQALREKEASLAALDRAVRAKMAQLQQVNAQTSAATRQHEVMLQQIQQSVELAKRAAEAKLNAMREARTATEDAVRQRATLSALQAQLAQSQRALIAHTRAAAANPVISSRLTPNLLPRRSLPPVPFTAPYGFAHNWGEESGDGYEDRSDAFWRRTLARRHGKGNYEPYFYQEPAPKRVPSKWAKVFINGKPQFPDPPKKQKIKCAKGKKGKKCRALKRKIRAAKRALVYITPEFEPVPPKKIKCPFGKGKCRKMPPPPRDLSVIPEFQAEQLPVEYAVPAAVYHFNGLPAGWRLARRPSAQATAAARFMEIMDEDESDDEDEADEESEDESDSEDESEEDSEDESEDESEEESEDESEEESEDDSESEEDSEEDEEEAVVEPPRFAQVGASAAGEVETTAASATTATTVTVADHSHEHAWSNAAAVAEQVPESRKLQAKAANAAYRQRIKDKKMKKACIKGDAACLKRQQEHASKKEAARLKKLTNKPVILDPRKRLPPPRAPRKLPEFQSVAYEPSPFLKPEYRGPLPRRQHTGLPSGWTIALSKPRSK